MGLELLALGAGKALDAYNNKQAQGRTEGAIRQGLALQAAERAKATGLVNKDVGYLQTSNPEADRAAVNGSFLDTLRANSGRADASTPVVNGANARYGQSVAANTAAADAHTQANADFIARLMAAQKQRQTEGQHIQDTATQIGGIQQDAGIDASQTAQNIQRVGQPNPWLSLGASFLTNAGTSGALGPKAMVDAGGPSQFQTAGLNGNVYASSPVTPQPSFASSFFH